MELSQKELNKLKAAADIVQNGDMAVIQKLIEFIDLIEDMSESRTLEVKDMEEMTAQFEKIKSDCEYCMTTMDSSMSAYKEEVALKLNETQALLEKVTAIENGNKGQIDSLDKRLTNEINAVRASIPTAQDMTVFNDELKRIEASIPEIPEQIKETPEELRDKLESLTGDERLDKSAIKGLDEELQSIRSIKGATSSGMFGMKQMRMVSFSFAGDASTTVFYLPKEPGAKGMAIWAYYQGQHLQLGTHFTVSNKTFTCVGFTPETGSTIEGFIII